MSNGCCQRWVCYDAKSPVTGMVELLSRHDQPDEMM